MPLIEQLSDVEIEKLRRRKAPREDYLQEYLEFLDGVQSSQWYSLTLKPGETQRAVKRRLTTSSKRKGVRIRYRKSEQGRILVEIL